MKLSIVIPAHNEEHRLSPMLQAYAAYFSKKYRDEVELIVVPNFCDDRTEEVAANLAQHDPNIRVLDDPGRVGKGGAIIAGVKEAGGDWVGFVDADGATSPEEFDRLYTVAQGSDGVIGSRWIRGAQVPVRQKGLRLLSSRLFNGLTRWLLGLHFKDTQCGAKIFTADAWKTILPKIGITRFAFDVDVLYQLKKNRFHVAEEPTVWNDVAGSTVRVMNTSIEMFLAIVRMRLVYSPFKILVRWYDRWLAHTVDFLLQDDLFRHAALLFLGFVITALGNIGFQMVVGRALPKAEYALFATFLALFAIASRPLGTLSTAMNHYTSLLHLQHRENGIGRLLVKWVVLTGGVSLLLAVLCVVFSDSIASFFHLERSAPVVVCAVALPALFMMPVLGGMLSGLQRFMWTSAASIFNAFARVGTGFFFVSIGFAACGWALAGHVAGLYVGFVILFAGLLPILRLSRADSRPSPSLRVYLFRCFLIQMSAAVLMTGDVVLVKHYLPGNTDFAYAATLGRMVAFMAASVAGAMFPKVASAGEFTEDHRAVYFRSQLYSSVFVGGSLLVCLLIPRLMLRVLFGMDAPDEVVVGLTRGMALAMAPATLLNVNINLLMAQRRFYPLVGVGVAAMGYLGFIFLYHTEVWQVVWGAGIANLLAFMWTTIAILKRKTMCDEEFP